MVHLDRKWAIRQSIGEAKSVIRITNLQTSIARVCDAWGRRKNPQPVLINCSIYLGKSFRNTSASDTLTDSTVNYGILSKSILEACQEFSNSSGDNPVELSHILHYLQQWLTGIQSSDKIRSSVRRIPLLQSTELDLLELDIILPKGSLHGNGVQMSASFRYRDRKHILKHSMTLKIFHLRTFTVIGVNDNERLARQEVIATLEIDSFDEEFEEDFCAVEQLTVMV
ncbi:Bgt-485 [Blumeria graminis f. sp. tritici]|uniref:Bgt-485 n=1 Tax=Blumeria graminis f. sp. tritici TaxID=62690 RepID=A0A9X9QCM3_BLUGR|nr:Bgt-485 [Blumeria graminis f. sp. tritici]